MKKFIENNINKIIAIFLLLQPVLDLLTGICINTLKINFTIGLIVRMLFLMFLCITSLFIYKKKKLLIPYSILIIYFIMYIIGMLIFKNNSFIVEIKNLGRVYYFPVLLITLYSIKDKIRISPMTLITVAFSYLILLFIPSLLGLGYQSYKVTKAGTLGFFNSANELSGIISILTPFILLAFYKLKKPVPIALLSLIYFTVILMIGTKTPLLALAITIGLSILYIWNIWLKEKNYNRIAGTIGAICVSIAILYLILPKTNFYKNIKTHLDYLGLDTITDVFKDANYIDHFIFSSRLEFLADKSFIYYSAPVYERIFGIGYINDKTETKLIEMDYFDIFYSHGVIGFILFFSITIYILKELYNDRKNNSYEYLMNNTSLFLISFLAFFTGHIFTAPSVSILVAVIMLSISKREKKDLLFAAYSLDIGGIEKALVNLVNRIDKEKFNITIVLEEKKGIFLPEVDSNIKVEELKVNNSRFVIIRKIINLCRKTFFGIINYHNYDFSACYATYSYSSSKIALMSSDNTAFYIHSNYKTIYPKDEDYHAFFDSRNVKEYKHIIFVSNEGMQSFIEKYSNLKEKCMVLNNYIDIKDIKEKSMEPIRIKKNKKCTQLVFVGRLEDASKKVLRQINLVKEIPNLHLWIIGDGPDRKKYELEVFRNNLRERITFLGKKSNPFPYMKEADYVILTSDYEGFPVTYLEAICLNKKIITTVPTSDEAIDINKIGYVISKDENEMVKQVKKIIKQKDSYKDIDLEKIQKKRDKKLEELFNNI